MQPLALNPYAAISCNNEQIKCQMFSDRTEITLDYDPALEALLRMADSVPSDSWFSEINLRFHVSEEEFESALSALQRLNILIPLDYLPEGDTVHARQDAFFVGLGVDGKTLRSKLKSAKVMILGCGGIGGNLVEQIAKIGVFNFILVDDDLIEFSNLNRSLVYSPEDVGSPKVQALQRWILSTNAHADVVIHQKRITCAHDVDNLLLEHPDVDLVIDCMDTPTKFIASVWVSEACWPKSIPHFIAGGYDLHGGLLGQTCIPDVTACARCRQGDTPVENNTYETFKFPLIRGSFMPIVRLVSSLQAIEIMRILTSYEAPVYVNKTYVIDASKMKFTEIEIEKKSTCPVCSGREVTRMGVETGPIADRDDSCLR